MKCRNRVENSFLEYKMITIMKSSGSKQKGEKATAANVSGNAFHRFR